MTPTMEEVAGWLVEAANDLDVTSELALYKFTRASIQEKAGIYRNRAAQVEAMGWRPIEEAQRSIEDRCLLCNGVTVVVGYWDGSRWINERSVLRSTYPATHFMPLPQPPVQK